MIKLTITRPNTIGTTFEKYYNNYTEAEKFIEAKCEQLADKGWEVCELKGSTSEFGTIEATHDHVADCVLIQWHTITK